MVVDFYLYLVFGIWKKRDGGPKGKGKKIIIKEMGSRESDISRIRWRVEKRVSGLGFW